VATRIWPTAHEAADRAARTAVAPLVWDPAQHVLSRFTFGPTVLSRTHVRTHGVDAWWSDQVALGRALAGYGGAPAVAEVCPLLTESPAAVRAWLKSQGNEFGWQAMEQLSSVTLGLQAWSRAQLYETVVDFFANHLNVANRNDDLWATRHTMDRDVIRRYAFGSYTDMLLASARNPAMLQYLNLASSNKVAINENYGRELLELHTVGLQAGYSEEDVKNSARILTGRTLDADFNYIYQPDLHWTGAVRVLGLSDTNDSAAAGEDLGDAYVRYLAGHPSTAQRLAQKLCVRYVSDKPSAALVAAVAKVYSDSGTQILPMLTAIFHSEEFWSSRGAKTRRPTENLIATVRALGVRPSDMAAALDTLKWMAATLGNVPLDWNTPDGYPDVATAWRSSSSLISLWKYHRGFILNWWNAFAKFDPATLYGNSRPKTSGEAIQVLTRRLTGSSFSLAHRNALQKFLAEPANTPIAKSTLQWLLVHLAPLILDAPYHALR